MTRKDYILIAAAIARMPVNGPIVREARDIAARELADALGRDNARFDRARFLKACGVQS